MNEAKRVLIVDDERSMCEMLAILLKKEGLEVCTAGSRAEAADLLRGGPVALVLTDVQLPDGDGLEILRHVKAASPETAVVVMTAYGTSEMAVAARKLGAEAYILKPFDVDELRIVVRDALANRRLRAEVVRLKREVGQELRAIGSRKEGEFLEIERLIRCEVQSLGVDDHLDRCRTGAELAREAAARRERQQARVFAGRCQRQHAVVHARSRRRRQLVVAAVRVLAQIDRFADRAAGRRQHLESLTVDARCGRQLHTQIGQHDLGELDDARAAIDDARAAEGAVPVTFDLDARSAGPARRHHAARRGHERLQIEPGCGRGADRRGERKCDRDGERFPPRVRRPDL